jgi:hypothetical protein
MARVTRRLFRPLLCSLAAFALGALAGPAGLTAAVGLTPHRAVYSLDLGTARSDSIVTQARGRMEFEWDDVCDGWTVSQRMSLSVVHRNGGEVNSNFTFNSWESKDGLSYRFFSRHFTPGGEDEVLKGAARLDGPGEGGVATYRGPEERRLELPRGTLFPTEHSLEMMALAERGALPVWRILFDGFGQDDLQGVSAALVKSIGESKPTSIESDLIAGQPSWRIHLAYFLLDKQTMEPDHEQDFRIFANGVVDELVIDYGDFTIDAVLEDLKPLPESGC